MSRKRKKPKKHKIKLVIGGYYNVHDGSPSGHPGQIADANYEDDIYLCVTLGSLTKKKKKNGTKRKDFLFLSVKTSTDVYKSLINKRPFLGTRDDYGDVEYINIKISEKDYNIVKDVLTKKPRIGFWLKQRNKKPSE